ncbi:MAG: class I SAM-dependent methyltransferase [Planctomycetota bacterium]
MSPDPVCVSCRSALVPDDEAAVLRCSGCASEFPVVAGRLPLLMADPAKYVAGEKMVLEHLSSGFLASADHYRKLAEAGGPRADVQAGIAAALAGNREIVGRLSALLPETDVTLSRYEPAPGVDLFASLRRDWGGSPEAEAEIRVTVDAILGAVEAEAPASTLLLGAGTGRVLAELAARLPALVGIDSSFAMAASFLLLSEEGELTASYPLQGNFLRAADEAERFTARRDLAPDDVPYHVSDAGELPFPAGTFDAVLSPYFTDLLPFSRLLPEMRRVLAPGGRFVHFGTFGWAFSGEDEYFALDEIPPAMAAHGFEVETREFVRNTWFADARRLNRLEFDNVLLVARRSGGMQRPAQ